MFFTHYKSKSGKSLKLYSFLKVILLKGEIKKKRLALIGPIQMHAIKVLHKSFAKVCYK